MTTPGFISTNDNFQTSINIAFDFGSREKIESLIPTDSVCRYLEELLQNVILPSSLRANLLVGPYGKGKSHVVLAALTAMWEKSPELFSKVAEAYRSRGFEFCDDFSRFVSDGPRILPVVVSGGSNDLQRSLLYSLRNALRLSGLEELMPQTNYEGAISVLERWEEEYPPTAMRYEELTGLTTEEARMRLRNLDSYTYREFLDVYPELTSGGSFDAFESADVLGVYDQVLSGLSSRGIAGLYIVYDEFSKYLEANIESASVEDVRLLQDLAEACNRSSQDKQLHLLLICHKSISNYIDDRLPREKVDGWRGVSGRFHEIVMADDVNQSYELVSNAIVKDRAAWTRWLAADGRRNEKMLERIRGRYIDEGVLDADNADLVVFGCYPLHPLSTFLLPRLSEKIAQNERTLFTFLCSEEQGAFKEYLEEEPSFVSPDAIYDYFEPLLRKEHYTSPAHRVYELARAALRRVEDGSVEARIIKLLALIDVVAQFETLRPTRQVVVSVFQDCGFEVSDVDDALTNLVDGSSIVYLRQSNSYLKLKEASGVRIDAEITDRAETLKSKVGREEILNGFQPGGAMYPSRHNAENSIVRYFDCGFVSCSDLLNGGMERRLVRGSGDGVVAAVFVESADEIPLVENAAKELTERDAMAVVAAPIRFSNISPVLYKYAAAKELKAESSEDEILAEEYDIVLEDYEEIISDFVAGYFRPELKRARYYANGRRKNGIARRSRFSELLSRLCDDAYPFTPRITSEALNKNELTGTATHSRYRILKGLCGICLEPDLGFAGNGQEVSMARSALKNTGVVPDMSNPAFSSSATDRGVRKSLGVIADFVRSSNHSCFAELYDALTGKEAGIGMRRGPIPIYLALVLREYRDEILITRDGEERPFSAETLDDIAVNPALYELTILNWTPEMASFTENLAGLFECDEGSDRNHVVESMKRWFFSLPQVTRNAKKNHCGVPASDEQLKRHGVFFGLLKRADTDANELLFSELPRVFGAKLGDPGLLAAIKWEKDFSDGYLKSCSSNIALELKRLFSPGALSESSLSSALSDWREGLPEGAESHVFSGANNQIINAIKSSCPDDDLMVGRLAKAATSLRIEDWNDARFDDFMNAISEAKEEAESYSEDAAADAKSVGSLGISFFGEDGVEVRKTFDPVECSPRTRLLKNSLVSCIADMGGSLSPDEKRQVVFEVLKGMC